MKTPQLPAVDYAMLYGQLSEAVNFAGLQITRNSRGIMTLEPVQRHADAEDGHVLCYGGVPTCWHVKPEDMPAQGVCSNCDGAGVIPYTIGQTPEQFEQGEYPCPECTPAQGIDPLPIYALTKAWMAKADNLATAPHVAKALYACAKEVRDVLPMELLA